MPIRYGRRGAYILSVIFYVLNAPAFAAPFGSWIDVKTECGAVGDGVADDTAAIQKGLDLIRPEDSKRKILYFPAGTYRITGSVQAVREKHRECQGVGLQGEGPDKSVIVYDGQGNEPMLRWGAWYSTVRGLGFRTADVGDRRSQIGDGGSVAGNGSQVASDSPSTISQLPSSAKPAKPTAGIWFGPGFSTANEVRECAFRDLPIGIQGGTDKTQGQAEVAVERCVFERCGFGLLLANWNSLDWWFWDCRFTDCGTAVSNKPGCGEFRLYRCNFERSKEADAQVGNLGTFALVENISRGSKLFFSASWGQTAGGNFTFQGNRVERSTFDGKIADQATPGLGIYMGNPGPVLMLDNQFIHKEGLNGPDIYFQSANKGNPIGTALLMGNTTTGSALYEKEKDYEVREIVIADSGVRSSGTTNAVGSQSLSSISDLLSTVSGVIEVAAGSGAEDIQKTIDGAKEGQVVHLPAGSYRLSRPIVIKTGKKVKIQGDGILNATVLVPEGDFGERGLIEVQPGGKLEARDLALQAPIQGGGALGMMVKTADTEGVAVLGNQVQTKGFGPGLVVEGLDNGRVILRNHGHNGVTVFGGPRAKKGEKVPGRVELLCGASSRDKDLRPQNPIYDVRQGGKILVRDIWYEGDPPEFMQVRDRGDLVFVGGHVAPNKGKGHAAADAIQMNGQAGSVLLAQAALNGADLTIGQLAEGFFVTLFGLTPYPETGICFADGLGGRIRIREDGKKNTDQFVQLMCRQNNTKITGSEPLADVNVEGEITDRFQTLRDWKLPPPDLDAPVKLHRVSCTGSIGMVVVSSLPRAEKK